MKRLFVAVNLAAEVNARIASRVLAPGTAAVDGVAWVKAENLHVTVKFLGATDPALVPAIEEALRGSAAALPFELVARGTGAFPSRARPRVLWVGIDDPVGALARLAADVENRLAALGFARETRRYSPHLTVARVKSARPPALDAFDACRTTDFGSSLTRELVLYESQTLPTGARYVPLRVIRAPGL
ncbi:MAG: RNA 2',3'-cyclic phosphodiesterase [Deltaproteobacteria bacterium]|nr:RNA 2',3'-cyclic phosphodiesterase [Deltaproteobacteria bacterium]